MLQIYSLGRAGVGAFMRDLVKSFFRAGAEPSFTIDERREAVAHDEPPVAAPEPPPDLRPRRGGRLIDLERRAKFARFDAI